MVLRSQKCEDWTAVHVDRSLGPVQSWSFGGPRTEPVNTNAPFQPEEVITHIDNVDTSCFKDEDMPALEPIPENDSEDLTDSEDPISRLCKIIMSIQSSGQHLKAFTTWIEKGNRDGLFIRQSALVVE